MSDLEIQDIPSIDLEIEPINHVDLEFSDIKVVEMTYNGEETDNITVTTDNINRTISATLKQVQYENRESFPEVGSDKLIYVDLSNNSLWVYKNGEYVRASSDLLIESANWVSIPEVTEKGVETKKIVFGGYFDVTYPDEPNTAYIEMSDIFDWQLNNKLDKPTNFGSQQGIMRYNPTTGVIDRQPTYQGVPASGQVPIATTGGALNVGTPTEDTHATTKKYVDDLADLKVSQIEYSKDQTFPDGSDAGVIGRAYIRFRDNTENSIVLNVQNAKYTIPVRDSVGNFYVGNPIQLYHTANKRYVDDKFNGASKPITYDTYAQMIEVLNGMSATDINRGQDIMIVQTGIPDVWVAYVEETSIPYTYVDDETFINELITNGTVQVGYYKLGYLETQKIDLEEYAKKNDLTEYVKIEQLNEKQDKLTAGENITIDENNVISATGGLNITDLPKFTNKLYINMFNATSLAGVLTLPIASSSNFIVDWGDGTTTDYVETTTEISHTYSGTHFLGWIYIYGDWKGLQFSTTADDNKHAIQYIVYDNNITILSNYALYGCDKLQTIHLPETLQLIHNQAFRNCTSLIKLDIPDYVSSLGSDLCTNCTSMTFIKLPTNTTSLKSATRDCTKLEEVIIPNTVTSITQDTFNGCENLKEIKLPDNLTAITQNLLRETAIKKIIIPEKVTSIANYSFRDCTSLKTVICENETPSSLTTSSFYNCDINNFFVKNTSLKSYKTATNWTAYANKIYPKGGNYSETITIPASSWDTATNTVTVEAVGSTSEDRNIITWNVSSGGVQVENTYGLKCTAQGTMSLTFSCETIPTEDVEVSVRYMLTNY